MHNLSHRFIEAGKDFPLIADALPNKVSVKGSKLNGPFCEIQEKKFEQYFK